jgi:Family of unknown function (DUF6127)
MSPVPPHTVIELTRADLDEIIEEAAHRGAAKALRTLGLEDDRAPHDIRDLRDLMKSWREVKSEALKTFAKIVTTFLLGAIFVGTVFQLGLKDYLSK